VVSSAILLYGYYNNICGYLVNNTSTERSQISGSLPRPKANLAERHEDKVPTPELKSTTNVLAPRTKIQTFTGKQDSSIQMYPKTDLDIWNSALGMY
jgi:hypothetical protein